MAATAAAWSTRAIRLPPKRSPRTFCMCGITRVVISPREWDMGRDSGLAMASVVPGLVVDGPEVVFADRGLAHHRDRGQPPLPVGGVEPLADQPDLGLGEAVGEEVRIV